MDLKEMKIKSMLPQGDNKIEHSVRIKLGLSCEEYCVFDTIHQRKLRKKDTSFTDIENHTGLLPNVIDHAIRKMSEIILLAVDNNKFLLNREMVKVAFQEKETQLENEFKIFWEKEVKNGNKTKLVTRWPGPKEAAFIKFKIARRKYSFDFIMQQTYNYFKFLTFETWRSPMQATKFLNVTSGQIKEDWVSQWPDYTKKEAKEVKPMTQKEKDKLYD